MLGHGSLVEGLFRLAKGERLAHGYVFFGQDGVGKLSAALSLGYGLEGREMPEGNLTGAPLYDTALVSVLPEESSLGIEAVRSVRNFLFQKPVKSNYRTLIVDSADRLTDEAQNAFLKIAEEPPPHALIILIVRDHELLWPTLVSRFQKIYFTPIPEREIAEWLSEKRG